MTNSGPAAVLTLCFVLYAVAVHAAGGDNDAFGARGPTPGRVEVFPYNPVANPRAVVVAGSARFTVLTDRVIRIEWSNKGFFEDRPTLAFLNRNTTVPPFTNSTAGGVLTITTRFLRLTYVVGRPFSSSSLSIVSTNSSSKFTSWRYGQLDTGNLFGTIKSLDELDVISLNCTQIANMQVHDESLHCAWGLISRNGWAIVNDTLNWGLTSTSVTPPEWWDSLNTDIEDFYFFGHGHDYLAALQDFTLLSGKITMVPRYATGIWWSRWYNVDNWDVTQIVDEYRDRGLPLDVYILDMDWHTKYGWGTYSFDTRLFPIPEATMDWLHTQGLATSVNLHDDDGVRTSEVTHNALARYMGLNPQNTGTIPFSMVNASYVYGLEDIVLKNLTDQGVDFWWIDWQQGGKQGGCAGGTQNPTIWLNHFRSTDYYRRGDKRRGIVLARWGGLGNHRYQVGFSGDVNNLSWQDLAFQPYFSMTATNVGFGFWSHDLVGPADDHEMHTRWLQWGAYSGVFRTHDRGMSAGSCANNSPSNCAIVEVWRVPEEYYEANRMVMLEREALVPLIYTGHRIAFDTGLSIIRPMYYSFPELPNAYAASPSTSSLSQYMFCGEDVMVSPITAPGDSQSSLASRKVWIPPGIWVEKGTGALHRGSSDGSTLLTKNYDLREVPVFIRGGAIVPSIHIEPGNTIGVAMRQYDPLVFTVYPGSSTGQTKVYEDDGATTAYIDGRFMWTTATYNRTTTSITFTVSSQGSGYPEFPSTRALRLQIANALPASSVTVNGGSVSFSRFGKPGSGTWHYNGQEVTLVVDTKRLSTSSPVTIRVNFITAVNDTLLAGVKGGIVHASWAKANLDEAWSTPGANAVSGGNVSIAASAGMELGYLAGKNTAEFMKRLNNFRTVFEWGVQEVRNIKPTLLETQNEEVAVSSRKALNQNALQRWSHSMGLLLSAFN